MVCTVWSGTNHSVAHGSARLRAAVPCAPRAPPSATATAVAQHRRIQCRGILDSYRRERGLPVPDDDSAGAVALQQLRTPPESSEDDDLECPVECVQELKDVAALDAVLNSAHPNTLIVIDFYKTACGACRFIEPGFVKLCRASQSQSQGKEADATAYPAIVFLKHNVYDDEEGAVTPLCKQLNIRSVPRFVFFKAGRQVEAFATREQAKVAAAIIQHAEPGSIQFGDWLASGKLI